jgi:hemolysin activation/secretion protein
MAVPGAPAIETPAGAAALFVTLSGVEVEGAIPGMEVAGRMLHARLVTGKPVSGAEIFAAVAALESAYAKAGYVLARVALPPQKLDNGAVLRVTLIEGFIERIETKSLPPRVRERIRVVVGPLVGDKTVTLREIERRLLLAGDTPGVILRSTLAPGSTPGATVLVLEAEYQMGSVLLSLDNTLPPSLGTYTASFGFDLNSALGIGDLIYVRILGNPNGGDNGFLADIPLNRTLAAGIVVPLGTNGLSYNLEVTEARTAPLPTIVGLQSSDLFQRLSSRLRYAWLRSRQANFSVEGQFDIESDAQTLAFGTTSLLLSQDSLRVFRLNADGDYLTPWGAYLSGRVSASFGVAGFGARTVADSLATGIPLSRQGADADFTKIEASLNYNQPVFEGISVSLGVRGQYSFGQALLRLEQFGMAMPSGLSTFDAGTLTGDSGVMGRLEISRPFELPSIIPNVGIVASPYLFGAAGEVFLEDPTVLEQRSISAASYGIGLRVNNGHRGTLGVGTLTVEYGVPVRNDNIPTSSRFTMLFSQKF